MSPYFYVEITKKVIAFVEHPRDAKLKIGQIGEKNILVST